MPVTCPCPMPQACVHIALLPELYCRDPTLGCWERGLTKFQQPAFSVRVEESVGEVIPVIFRDFKGFVFYALIEILGQKMTLHVSF